MPGQHYAHFSVQPKQRVHAPVSLSPACPSIQELKNASASLFLPSIEYLNIQEFQAIPRYIAIILLRHRFAQSHCVSLRYMKGRLKYDQVNDLIAQMNAAMEAKYRLMHSAKSKKISEAKFKRVQVMKSQENKATKGTSKVYAHRKCATFNIWDEKQIKHYVIGLFKEWLLY